MLKKNYKLLLLSLLLCLASCASVPNVPICAEVTIYKGICTYTVSKKEITIDDSNYLDNKTWFEIRRTALTVPASSWAEMKSFLVKMCKKYKCDEDISSWDRNIEGK